MQFEEVRSQKSLTEQLMITDEQILQTNLERIIRIRF